MFVKTIDLEAFRGIGTLEINCTDTRPVVFIGENGTGKSSILECIAILLSHFTARIRNPKSSGRSFTELDIMSRDSLTKSFIEVDIGNTTAYWQVTKSRQGTIREDPSNYGGLSRMISLMHQRMADPLSSIPLVAYYPTNRAVLNIPLDTRNGHEFDRLDAYASSLVGAGVNFRTFFEWFRNQEDVENKSRDPLYRDHELEAVRQAIQRFLPNYSDLRVRRKPNLRMTVTKGFGAHQEELLINQLSDGEKCIIALIGDIARRLAIANPGMENPLFGEGVILIDEIELHLHPIWQRRIITALTQEIFQNCQFIVTTHSPLVISEVEHGSVYSLESVPGTPQGVKIMELKQCFGRDSNSLLEDAMGASERPRQIKDELNELFRVIDDGDLAAAKEMRKKLADRIGGDEPDLVKAEVMVRRKEILR